MYKNFVGTWETVRNREVSAPIGSTVVSQLFVNLNSFLPFLSFYIIFLLTGPPRLAIAIL